MTQRSSITPPTLLDVFDEAQRALPNALRERYARESAVDARFEAM